MTIVGVDMSVYQGDGDFDKLAAKVNFVMIRAALVKTKDAKLVRNVTEAKRVGLPYGLFFVPIPPGLSGFQDQAYFHADLLAEYSSQIYPAFDLEVDGGLSTADLGAWMAKYIHWFCYRSGITDLNKLMTYTRASWMNYQMPLTDDIFWRTLLWLADYTPPVDTIPQVWAKHNQTWKFVQTGIYKPATDYGFQPPPYAAYGIDLDEFYGTADDFYNLFGVMPHDTGELPPPPPPPPAELPKYVYVKANGTNVRNAPILAELSDIGDLIQGATLEVTGESGDFYQVKAFVHKSVVEPVEPLPPVVVEWRVMHDYEYQDQWRSGVPEVYHFDLKSPANPTVKLTEAWQRLILALNPGMAGGGFRSLLKWDRAFTNGNAGFDFPSGPPRADYINGRDLDADPPFLDKDRCCGAAILHGRLSGNILTIETLDGTRPPPALDYVLAHPWLYFECFTVRPDGQPGRFPQNGGKPVYMPLVACGPVTVEVNTIVPGKPYPYVTKKA